MNTLQQKINDLDSGLLVETIYELGGGQLDNKKNTVRARLLEEYEKRFGEKRADKLLDKLGM